MTEWKIRQGPRWLAELMYAPPGWVWWVLASLFVGSMLTAGYVLHRDGIDEEIQAEILSNGLTTSSVALATVVSVTYINLSYVGDILIGLFVGIAVAFYAPAASRDFIEEVVADGE